MSTEQAMTSAGIGVFYDALPLDTIEASKTNPRKHFDQADLEDLAKSIKEKGVIQPIVVRPHPKGSSKLLWEIIAGERRYRASKIAGVPTIPAIARNLDDRAVLEIQVIENLQRENIHELEEAHGYQRLMKEANYDAKLIADKVGKSLKYIYDRLKLLSLTKELQKQFIEGELTAGHAILLARLPEESQRFASKNLIQAQYNNAVGTHVKNLISVRDLGAFIQSQVQMDLAKAPFDTTDNALVKAVGSCVTCPKRTGAEAHLWPEIGSKDLCLDRGCFQKKMNAYVEKLIEENDAIRLTSDYSKQNKSGFHYVSYGMKAVPKSSCDYNKMGVIVDGQRLGEKMNVCVSVSCKVHSGRGGSSRSERSITTPTQQFENAKKSIDLNMRAELNRRIYAAAIDRLAILDTDVKNILKPRALTVILRLVFQRLDSSVRKHVLDEMKLSKADMYGASAVEKLAGKMDANRILALIVRLAMKNLSLGFTGGWGSDSKQSGTQLLAIAADYGVKIVPIEKEVDALKAEKLKKAKARLESAKKNKGKKKLQTSAKRKPAAAADPDDDAEMDLDEDVEFED